ncbi:FAD/NAD(P)-binding oxidoreductase [Chromobacterium sp. IIBBL 290-4]|uniref:NAD(P)/FAD-dependent oxidoreductase n=1 Tax=Chromobacterium sp. IIBBL 290-4 TaxID=2953890 RepID=UPI0020B7D3BE|nr:FAD/NAD(P)-binding oxidoreductase [Chromobacterium sp. IIBBL 290-4]UTH72850.1 NAD(P)/FAD-dependent oxidoreductase [Chromobacterium sp. IIBBL 290-4]
MERKPVIVGGGPAGLSAAIELASHGVDSLLLEEASRLGGVVYRGPLRDGVELDYLGERYCANMRALHGAFDAIAARVDIRLNTRVIGGNAEQLFALTPQERTQRIPYSHLLLSVGCHERSVPFPGWTLPGVIMLGGLQLQIKSGVVKPLGRTVLAGTGPLLPLVACQLRKAGVEVVGVYEASAFSRLAKEAVALLNQPQLFLDGLSMLAYLKRHGVPFHFGWGVIEGHGDDELRAVTVAPYNADWTADHSRAQRLPAQTLASGYGFLPRTQLTQQMGLAHGYDEDGCLKPDIDDWQRGSLDRIHLAGDVGGLKGGEAAMLTGRIAALSMLRQLNVLDDAAALRRRDELSKDLAAVLRFRAGINRFTRRGMGQLALPRTDTVICRCEHVTRQDIDTALGQGVNDLISLKMRTRVSMGDCQGKMCVGYCSDRLREHTGKHDVGWIRPRFPLDPLPFSAFSALDAQQTEEI